MLTVVNDSLYNKPKGLKLNKALNAVIFCALIIIIFEVVFSTIFSGIYVIEDSMLPTLTGAVSEKDKGGDYVYVNRYAQPDYGDIVVVTRDDGTAIIKRVIAFGGDAVKLDKGKLYIKYKGDDQFVEVEEKYVSAERNSTDNLKNTYPKDEHDNLIEQGHVVKEGCMFLLGDNRDVSMDSRRNGDYSLKALYGVVADWSLSLVNVISAIHNFFSFTLPGLFGIK